MADTYLKILSTLVGLTAMATAGAQASTKPAAVVNGQPISSATYVHRMEHLNGVYAAYGQRLVEVPPGLIALDRLITEQATIQLAQSHSVAPTTAEIDSAYQARLASNPTMEKDAVAAGLTVDDLRYQVLLDLSRFKLLTEGVLVTDAEVQQNYDLHQDLYAPTKLVTLRIIVVSDTQGQDAVDADLTAGKDFASVAMERSVDISKVRGGLIQGARFDSLDQPVRDALSAIKIGQTTTWVPLPAQSDGSKPMEKVLFVGASQRPAIKLDATLRDSIRRQMMMDRGTIRNNVAKEVEDALVKANVEISDPVFAKAWKDLRARATGAAAKAGT